MKFSLTDYNDITNDIDTNDVHTIIQDTYTIYVIFSKKGVYQTFPNTPANRANLPNIKLASENKI